VGGPRQERRLVESLLEGAAQGQGENPRRLLRLERGLTMRCSEPGHRVAVAIERPRGPGR